MPVRPEEGPDRLAVGVRRGVLDPLGTDRDGLRQLVRILEPLARACKCLESSKATAGDVTSPLVY